MKKQLKKSIFWNEYKKIQEKYQEIGEIKNIGIQFVVKCPTLIRNVIFNQAQTFFCVIF